MPNTAGGLGGTVRPPAGPVQSPGGVTGGEILEDLKTLYFTLPKIVLKSPCMRHFFYVLHLKVKGKLIKITDDILSFTNFQKGTVCSLIID